MHCQNRCDKRETRQVYGQVFFQIFRRRFEVESCTFVVRLFSHNELEALKCALPPNNWLSRGMSKLTATATCSDNKGFKTVLRRIAWGSLPSSVEMFIVICCFSTHAVAAVSLLTRSISRFNFSISTIISEPFIICQRKLNNYLKKLL